MPASVDSGSLVRFGVFEADLHSGELYKCGVKVRIQELPFQALRLFLRRPNEVLSREDLRHALWSNGVFVEFDRGIISTINRLRETLGDHAENPVFIETVGRRGYRWIAPTQLSEPQEQKASETPPKEVVSRRNWRYLLLVLLFVALVFATSIYWARHRSAGHSTSAGMVPASPSGLAYPHAPANREAEEFYLKGRYYWEKRTPDSLNKAVDSFTQAIVHDPAYAPAYVGLADSYNLLREYTLMPASEAYSRALAAAEKAVELDPQSSEAHASLAFVSFYGMWDAAKADWEFRRAIELNPDNAAAHHWYATYLSCLHRFPESLTEIDRARALDPASKSVLADKGSILFSAGRRQDAITLLQQMEENEPDFISPHRYLKFIYLRTGDYPHYLGEARKEAGLLHDSSALAMVEVTEKGFSAAGEKGLLQALSLQQKKLYDRGLLSPWFLAQTQSIMGNKAEALRYLRTAYDRRDEGIPQIESDPAFDSLQNEPAFRKLLADAGLPPLD
ncbi:MAG: tetratricopeptide repeat protein [Candidatus Sulfotelmatobacter sp.]